MYVFELAPMGMKTNWWTFLIVGISGLVVIIILLMSRPPKFEVSPEGLRVRHSLFSKLIPASQLRIDEAYPVDLSKSIELRPKWRTMGIGLPGYQGGWFRLQNGEKALVFLTDVRRAIYIPTTAGYSLLISPADPDEFMSVLRNLGP